MITRENRIAWLLNHTSLREAELPVIRQLGLEVYTSKRLPEIVSPDFRSQSANYDEDRFSTLPQHALSILNDCRWYEQRISSEASTVLNEYFGTVICSQHPTVLRNVLQHFGGKIVLRAFGFPGTLSYGEYFSRRERRDILEAILKVKERFWFAPFYDSVARFETGVFAERAIVLPIGLPPRVVQSPHIWVGDKKRILFVCPSIQTDQHYHGPQYKAFKTYLGDLPHTIIGHQEIPVPDPDVIGYVSQQALRDYFASLSVLFYPSREARHIQYHPFEAAIYGMPVIYFKDSLLYELAGGGDLLGSCRDYAEAHLKLKRILEGDETFIRDLLESQLQMPNTFLPPHVTAIWKQNFINGIVSSKSPQNDTIKLPTLNWDIVPPSIPLGHSAVSTIKRKFSTLEYEAKWIFKRWLGEIFNQHRLMPRDTGIKMVIRHNQLIKRIAMKLKITA